MAYKWQAQLNDNSKFTGGGGDPSDVDVASVPTPLVKIFTASSTSGANTMYWDHANSTETWYQNGKPFTPTFPMTYPLVDGTTLTISRNSNAPGDLSYVQQ